MGSDHHSDAARPVVARCPSGNFQTPGVWRHGCVTFTRRKSRTSEEIGRVCRIS